MHAQTLIITSVEVELPQQLSSIGKPLVLAIFGSELAILLTAFFCCFIVICRLLVTKNDGNKRVLRRKKHKPQICGF